MKQLYILWPLVLPVLLLLVGCSAALAQDVTPAPLPTAGDASMLLTLVEQLGWPGALAAASWVLSRALAKWTPTIRIVLVDPDGGKDDASE